MPDRKLVASAQQLFPSVRLGWCQGCASSPGSHAGKGAARHDGGRLKGEARADLFAGANLLLTDSTGLCGSAAVPEQPGNFCRYPWDWSSPASQTPSTPPDRVWLVPLQAARMPAEMQGQCPRLPKPWGKQSTYFTLHIALPVRISSA